MSAPVDPAGRFWAGSVPRRGDVAVFENTAEVKIAARIKWLWPMGEIAPVFEVLDTSGQALRVASPSIDGPVIVWKVIPRR